MDGRRISPLIAANIGIVVAVALHGADHFRQSRGIGALTTEVLVGGYVIGVLALTSLVFALRSHPRAPLLSAMTGLWIAAGVTASHFAPHWSAFSDPYFDLHLDAVSWVAALLEVLAGLVLAATGIVTLRRSGTRSEVAIS